MQWSAAKAGKALPSIDKLGRRPALDGFRGVAALSVVLVHSQVPPFVSGQVGVDMFFVLSGFLITSVLIEQIDRGRLTYGSFLERRARRLLPAYFVVVLACLVLEQVLPMGGTNHGALFGFLYVANWWEALSGHGLGLLGHTWALQIEEQFYVVWPLLLIALIVWTRGRLTRLALAISGVTMLSVASRFVLWGADAPWHRIEFGTDTRVAGLLVGCAVGVLMARSRRAFTGRTARLWDAAGIACLVALVAAMTFSVEDHPLPSIALKWPAVNAIAIVCIVAVVAVPTGALARILSVKPLVLVAEVSYGLYLWHYPVLALLDAHFGLAHWWVRFLGWGITALLSVLSYRFVEQPALTMSFRRHRAPGPSEVPLPVAGTATTAAATSPVG